MMTPHAQNLALAKLDGWISEIHPHTKAKWWRKKGAYVIHNDNLPKYTESLDALRPIILKMGRDDQKVLLGFLASYNGGESALFNIATASAPRVAEAILRTVGKYT